MPHPEGDFQPELWDRIEGVFDRMMEDADPLGILALETDPQVIQGVKRLLHGHQQATATQFLEEPVGPVMALKEPPPMQFIPGQLLAGRFTVERALGVGGMGEVYLADDASLNEKVAIKTVRMSLAYSTAITRRFVAEIQSARRVSHQNVCRIYDLFEDGNTPFFSMEYLDGVGLHEWLSFDIPPAVRRRVALSLAEGLHAAHRNGILHCDLKPANVMMTGSVSNPRPVITDFGLARAFTGSVAVNLHSMQAGTLDYMAPEMRANGHATVRSDIFAYGKVLGLLLPGHKLVAACTAPLPASRPASMDVVIQRLRGGTSRRIAAMAAAAAPFAALAGYLELTKPRLNMLSHQRLIFNWFRPSDSAHAVLMRDLLISSIRQSLRVTVEPDDHVRLLLKKAKLPAELPVERSRLMAVADSEGIRMLVDGTIVAAGAGLGILLQVFLPGERRPALEIRDHEPKLENLVKLAERVAIRLGRIFGDPTDIPNSGYRLLSQMISANSYADECYFHGVRLYEDSEAKSAIEWFDKAIAADPQFALAYISKGLALSSTFQLAQARPTYKMAFDLKYRASQCDELWIEYQYYSFIRNNQASLNSALRLIALYPGDATYQRSLAFAYAYCGHPANALTHNRQSVDLNPTVNNVTELVTNTAEANQFDEALTAVDTFRQQGVDSNILDFGAGLAWMGKGDMERARTAFLNMKSDAKLRSWGSLMLCAPAILEGSFAAAESSLVGDLANDTASKEDYQTLNRYAWLGRLNCLMDVPGTALVQARHLLDLEVAPDALDATRDAALIALEAGDQELANKALRKLRQIESGWPSTRTRGVLAHIEGASRGHQDEAGPFLAKAVGLWPDAPAYYSQARWYAGRDYNVALTACGNLDVQQGRILKHHFPGLMVLGWIEKARSLVKLSRFEEARRLYKRIALYWLRGNSHWRFQRELHTEIARLG